MHAQAWKLSFSARRDVSCLRTVKKDPKILHGVEPPPAKARSSMRGMGVMAGMNRCVARDGCHGRHESLCEGWVSWQA